ncbi:MAG: DUF1501 domain-containing protein [Saprospiraceae bacterium]
MKRRSFLKLGALASAPIFVNGFKVHSYLSTGLLSALNNDTDRILVLIQLNGGNDGLSTLLPLDQYAALSTLRSPVLIPESAGIKLNNETALHPAMTDLNMAWQDGKVQLIQGVGYPNQNRSHFRSQDIWITASDANQFLTTGWLGRYLDCEFPGYPNGFPNPDNPDPIALTIGNTVSETCQGVNGNYSLSVIDPNTISVLDDPNLEPVPANCYGMELSFLREAVKQTNQYNDTIKQAAAMGTNLGTKYNADNALAQKLKTVARLISGGLKTRVYVVNQGGFDTHAGQVNANDKTTGAHANLLRNLSNAICAFQDDLSKLGVEERVIGMTFSEFGRRIKTTGTGTDHGSAAPMILFGSCINPILLGTNPVISPNTTDQEGVAMQYDFRSVYGSVLNQWFKVDKAKVQTLIYPDYQDLPIILGCSTSKAYEPLAADRFELRLLGNPVQHQLNFAIAENKANAYTVELYNETGFALQRIKLENGAGGQVQGQINLEQFSSGAYFLRVSDRHYQKVERVVKI